MINVLKRVICHTHEGQTFIVSKEDYKKLSKRIRKGECVRDLLQVIEHEMETEDNNINYDNMLVWNIVFITDDNKIFDMPSDELDEYFVTKVMKEKGMNKSEFKDFHDRNLREALNEAGYEIVNCGYQQLDDGREKLIRIGDLSIDKEKV